MARQTLLLIFLKTHLLTGNRLDPAWFIRFPVGRTSVRHSDMSD